MKNLVIFSLKLIIFFLGLFKKIVIKYLQSHVFYNINGKLKNNIKEAFRLNKFD